MANEGRRIKESQYISETASANFRVFIAGTEVTDDVVSIKIQYHDGNETSMAQVSLTNEFDKYVITPREMAKLAGVEEKLEEQIYVYTAGLRESNREQYYNFLDKSLLDFASQELESELDLIFPGDMMRIKRKMMNRKFFLGSFIKNDRFGLRDKAAKGKNVQGLFPRLQGHAPNYQIYSGSTIFHTSDVIRIFLQDPYDPYVWYYGFSGYITNDSDVLTSDNNKTVNFTCEDVLRPFKYTRTTINPQIVNPEVLTLFTDTAVYSGVKEAFNRLPIPLGIMIQVFGGEPLGIRNRDLGLEVKNGENLQGRNTKFYSGVGNFDFKNSRIFIFGEEPNRRKNSKFLSNISDKIVRIKDDDLSLYQAYVDNRVRVEDLIVERQDDDESGFANIKKKFFNYIQNEQNQLNSSDSGVDNFLDIRTSPIYKTITFIGENLDIYPIDGRVIMMLPGSLNPTTNSDVLFSDFSNWSVTNTSFSSKFQLMKLYATRLDFSLFSTPRGDILFEMPFYDFYPDDFGVDPTIPAGANRGIYTLPREMDDNDWPKLKGPAPSEVLQRGNSNRNSVKGTGGQSDELPSYAHAFTLAENHQVSAYSRTFSDANIRTIFTTGYFIVQNFEGVGESRQVLGRNVAAVAESLVPSFGARHEAINPEGYIASPEGAELFAELKLNKNNSSATNVSINIDAKFDLFLNRPIRIKHKEILSTLRSYTHEIDVDSTNLSTSFMEMNCTRVWAGGVVDDETVKSVGGEARRIYEPIGTFASKPIDYSRLFYKRNYTVNELKTLQSMTTARESDLRDRRRRFFSSQIGEE